MDSIINWQTSIPLNLINATNNGVLSLLFTISEHGSSEKITTTGFLKNGVFHDWDLKPLNLNQYEIIAFAVYPDPYSEE